LIDCCRLRSSQLKANAPRAFIDCCRLRSSQLKANAPRAFIAYWLDRSLLLHFISHQLHQESLLNKHTKPNSLTNSQIGTHVGINETTKTAVGKQEPQPRAMNSVSAGRV